MYGVSEEGADEGLLLLHVDGHIEPMHIHLIHRDDLPKEVKVDLRDDVTAALNVLLEDATTVAVEKRRGGVMSHEGDVMPVVVGGVEVGVKVVVVLVVVEESQATRVEEPRHVPLEFSVRSKDGRHELSLVVGDCLLHRQVGHSLDDGVPLHKAVATAQVLNGPLGGVSSDRLH